MGGTGRIIINLKESVNGVFEFLLEKRSRSYYGKFMFVKFFRKAQDPWGWFAPSLPGGGPEFNWTMAWFSIIT
jgi:hypothetical protein